MKIRKKLMKEVVINLLIILTEISVIIASTMLDPPFSTESIIGIAFIFGLPCLLCVRNFIRRLQLYPKEGFIEGNTLRLNYYDNREVIISLSEILEVNMLIHSQKTAVLEFQYYDTNRGYINVQFSRADYSNFIEFSRVLMNIESPSCSTKVHTIKYNNTKERSEFSSLLEWDDYLTESKTISRVFEDIINENPLKSIAAILGIIVVALLRNDLKEESLAIMTWVIIAMLFLYMIFGFILRIKGFSRSEIIGYFLSGIFFILFGLISIIVIILGIF